MRLSAILAAFSAMALTVFVTPSASALAIYDGFAYPSGNLAGNTNPSNGATWTGSNTTSDVFVNAISSLATPPNLPPGTGEEVQMLRNRSGADRLGINSDNSVVSTGALYYSLLIRVSDLGGVPANTLGVFIAGFNNSVGTATSSITQAGARLHLRAAGGTDTTHYELGIRNDVSSAVGTANAAFDTNHQFTAADTVWVVAKYQFNTGSNTNDVASIWVNPDPLAFVGGNEPTPDATSTGADINQLQIGSFFLFQRLNAQPNAIAIDEVRIADNSDGIIPEPGMALPAIAASLYLLPRRRCRQPVLLT
jgi:hypothetical protein